MDKKTIHLSADPSEFKINRDGIAPLQRCENCCYWGRLEGGGTCCRLKPPTAIPLISGGVIAGLFAVYPPTRAHDWCGGWRSGYEADA